VRLVAEVQQEYVVRYGGPDATRLDPSELAPPTGAFLVGYRTVDGEDLPVACGGVRRLAPGVAELKRMYVHPDHRRQGLSRVLLAALEEVAAGLGHAELRLETGDRQPEAVALYDATGYTRIAGYGHYRGSPENVCFAKRLAPGTSHGARGP
jgi:GNAT superfamily N-acetyltransferase